MANTNPIEERIHPYVRDWLKERYGVAFDGKKRSRLMDSQGDRAFDAVSTDGRIVAEIKTASGKSGGEHPGVASASGIEQVYYLLLADAKTKVLVMTDPEFFEIMKKKLEGNIPSNIELVYCRLPEELANIVRSIEAGEEMDHRKRAS